MRFTFTLWLVLITSIVSRSQSIPSYVPTEGLVAWYPFNGNANDQSGNGYHLKINGPVLTADRMSSAENAFLFKGTPEAAHWLEPANSKPFATEQFTYSVWIKPTDFNPVNAGSVNFYYQGIIGYFPSSWTSGPAYTLSLFQLDNARLFTGNWTPQNRFPNNWTAPHSPANNKYQLLLSDPIIKINHWSHVAVTFDGMILTLFMNGKKLSSISSSVSYANQLRFIIGGNADGPDGKIMGGFQGIIDDVGFWNRALSDQELTQLYKGIGSFGTVKDVEGNSYNTVLIGDQEWMAENLRTSTFSNGDPIPFVADRCEWSMLTTPAYSFPENESKFNIPYGKLYNWYVVADPRNACPTGWHAPTDMELKKLVQHLDSGANTNLNFIGPESYVAAALLKDSSEVWSKPNPGTTNESGFSFLPAGHREFYGAQTFTLGRYGYLWTTTAKSEWQAWGRYMGFETGLVYRYIADKRSGYSIRCLKGEQDPSANTAPTDIMLSSLVVLDNIPDGSVVGSISARDNEGGSIYFLLVTDSVATDNAKFKISHREPAENTLVLLDAPDQSKKPFYTVHLRATDGGGMVTEKEFKIEVERTLPAWLSIPSISLLTGVILSVISITVLALNYRRRRGENNEDELLFERMELELIQAIFNKPDHTLLIDDINVILGTNNKSVEVQKKHRSDMVKSINEKYSAITKDIQPLLEKQRLENDKRLFRYSIQAEKYKKINSLIALSQQVVSRQNGRA